MTTTETKTFVEKDTDRDGIIDMDDPHPQIAEIYVVKDDDGNGIADWLEAGK